MESGGGSPYHGMRPMGGSEPTSPYHARPVEVQERPFIVGLLLTIITLGIYGWYWHYRTHEELSRQLGHDNKEKGLWIGYIVTQVTILAIVVVFLAAIIAAVAASETERRPFADDEAAEEAVFEVFFSMLALILLASVAWVIGLILFIVYVVKQYEAVTAARRAYGLQEKPGAAWFFGFYFGSMVAGAVIPFAYMVGAPVAYYNLQEHYNEIHRVVAGKQPAASSYGQAPPGYAERYQQQQTFGTRPDTSGHGAPSDAPAYGGPGTPHTYYGSGGHQEPRRPTWGAPSTQGYRIGERAAGTPPREAPQVEQTFRCPRCHGHVTARGPAGGEASIQCAQCGEGGVVRLPE